MSYENQTSYQARLRHRAEMAAKGIPLGCHKVTGAKQKFGDQRIGKCLVCQKHSRDCTCDLRSPWWKGRIDNKYTI